MSVVQESAKRQELVRFIERDMLPMHPQWYSITVRSPEGYKRHIFKPALDIDDILFLRGICEDGTPFKAAWEDIMMLECPEPLPISR